MTQQNYLNVKEVAKSLGISERMAFDLLHDRKDPLPYHRIGKRIIRVSVQDLDRWMQSKRAGQGLNQKDVNNVNKS